MKITRFLTIFAHNKKNRFHNLKAIFCARNDRTEQNSTCFNRCGEISLHLCMSIFRKVFGEKCLYVVERYNFNVIVQIGVYGIGNYHKFFVVALQFGESVFAEIAGMCLFAMNYKHGASDLVRVAQNGHVQK